MFSDTEVFDGSSFSSGTVDLEIDSSDGEVEDGELAVDLEFETDILYLPSNSSEPDRSDDPAGKKDKSSGRPEKPPKGGRERGVSPKHWGGFFEWSYKPHTFDVTVSLPNDGEENNPAYVWVGAKCPEGDAEQYTVTIRYKGDGQEDSTAFHGSLTELVTGIPLDPGDHVTGQDDEQGCLNSGKSIELEIEVDPANVHGKPEDAFDLVFEARQCRNTEPQNPFPLEDEDCDTPTPTPTPSDPEEAFSFVGFCSSVDEKIKPKLTLVDASDGSPKIAWETAVDVDFVVVKKSTVFTIYDYRGEPRDSGIASWKDPDADESEWDMEPGDPSRHCTVAADAVGADDYEAESSTKLDWEDGPWEVQTDE